MVMMFRPGQRLVMPGVQVYSGRAAAGGAFTGVLDGISNVAAAYSLRRLSGSYSGAAVRVRRSSDSTEQDIGFTVDGDFDSSAFSSFVGGGTGYVRTWYDQSGNGRDATQTSTSLQPFVALSIIGGQPVLSFSGTVYLSANSLSSIQSGIDLPLTGISLINPASATPLTTATIWGFGNNASTNQVMQAAVTTTAEWRIYRRDDSGSVAFYDEGAVLSATSYIHGFRFTGTQANQYVNGAALSALRSMNMDTLTPNQFAIGTLLRNSAANFWPGYIGELIIASAALSTTDHNTIGSDMASYYGLSWTTVT